MTCAWHPRGLASRPLCNDALADKDGAGDDGGLYLEFKMDRYNVQKTPHEDWNGTRYAKGMNLKLITCASGHTCQLVISAGLYMSEYLR